MCLFLEMLSVKKCRDFQWGEIFPCRSGYFPHAENLELVFCYTAFVDKIIKVNI